MAKNGVRLGDFSSRCSKYPRVARDVWVRFGDFCDRPCPR